MKGVASIPHLPTNEFFDVENDDKYLPPCQRYSRKQWIGFDVVLLTIVNGVCRNTNPKDCIFANPLNDKDIGVCVLNPLVPMEVPSGWWFSLWRWLHWSVMHKRVSLWNHAHHHKQIQDA